MAGSTFRAWTNGRGVFEDSWMNFKIIGVIDQIETFAVGSSIRELARLKKLYGDGRWRKRKGIAEVHMTDGSFRAVELHWYEASGIGRREFKIKRFVD
jgi:hypothetical protein